MTDRRRFFPAKTVQQVPGQRVEVEVGLKKDGKAPCAPTGFFWGSRQAFMVRNHPTEDEEYESFDPNSSLYVVKIDSEYRRSEHAEPGTAWIWPDDHNEYNSTSGEWSVEVKQVSAMLAIPLGQSCGLTWSIGWEGYKPNRHIEFSQDGPVAIIHVRTIEGVNEYNQGTAILTASCAGKTVGTLRLVVLPDEQW
jgi:hypothetical protein